MEFIKELSVKSVLFEKQFMQLADNFYRRKNVYFPGNDLGEIVELKNSVSKNVADW
jgi:hypothetical protein